MKKFYTLLVCMLVAASLVFAQNEVVVNLGDNINDKIAEVEEGGTLLIMPGAHKANADGLTVTKSITIKSATDAVNDTRIHIKQIDVEANNVSITLDGLILSGADVDSLSGVEVDPTDVDDLPGDYCVNLISGTGDANAFGDIVLKNCVIRHFDRSVIRGDRDSYYAENILVDNCIIWDLRGGGDYGPFRLKSRITFDTFTIKNSTFYKVLNRMVELEEMPSYPVVIKIEACTFNEWGGGKSGNYLFDLRNNDQASLTIKNCILGKTNVSEEVSVNGFRLLDDNSGILYCEMQFNVLSEDFIIENGTVEQTPMSIKQYNYVMDPGFADPENGNFHIADASSDLYFMSEEGTLVGDPRWANEPVSSKQLKENTVRVYPTIASKMLFIETDETTVPAVNVYTNLGQKVLQFTNVVSGQALNISSLSKGVYIIDVEGNHPVRIIKK
ncbi:MAG: DUF5123 domain-containing protein [Prolixibacteraceae bacterium]|nr:DUF5123 domain-containing protein [Prolixibacteraceae bacterium]